MNASEIPRNSRAWFCTKRREFQTSMKTPQATAMESNSARL